MGVNLEQDALENPTQRAFAYVSAMKDLQNHGTGADPNPDNNGTALKMEPGGASQFLLMAPSIGNMVMGETKSQLTINGIFGDTSGSVQAGGTSIPAAGLTYCPEARKARS